MSECQNNYYRLFRLSDRLNDDQYCAQCGSTVQIGSRDVEQGVFLIRQGRYDRDTSFFTFTFFLEHQFEL